MSIIQTKIARNQDQKLHEPLPNGSASSEPSVSQLSTADKAKLLQWNKDQPQRLDICVHKLVLDSIKSQPDALAVCAWDGDLTYSELDQAASRLAIHLIKLGVGPEVMVAFCMSKSKFAPIVMLAILYAGGVVVPLGVEHPLKRLEVILRDSGAGIVLVDAEQGRRIAPLSTRLVRVDNDFLTQLPIVSNPVRSTVGAGNAAWIIYTSGSTGIPKGVVLDHAGISTVLKAHGATFKHFGPGTRRLQFANHVFDVAIADVIGSLVHGACVCIPSEDDRMSNLSYFMNRMGVNFTYFTATMAGFIAPSAVPSVKTILIGGEKVNPSIVERWLGFADVHIAYGPSECTVHAFHSKALSHKDQASTIGFPLTSQPWICFPEDQNRLVAIGEVGELLVEGVALSRGYLGDPDKTAAAFLFDPDFIHGLGLSGEGRRMYRTGDLVRQNHVDGSLNFVSRKDTQIKISGQRVETSEIESWVLQLLPDVHSAVVDLISVGGDGGRPTLTLIVDFKSDSTHAVAGQTTKPEPLSPSEILRQTWSQLREALSNVLPKYMVPALFVPMTKLPLTITGKTDRRNIQELVRLRSLEDLTAYTTRTVTDDPPNSEVEQILRKVFAETLCLPQSQIGRNDDLFQLGADSISAMRVVHRTRPHNLNLAVADIFQHPTVSGLAAIADSNKSSNISAAKKYRPFSLLEPKNKDAVIDAICPSLKLVDDNRIVDVFPATDFQALCVCANLMRSPLALQHFFVKGTGPHSIEHLRQACLKFLDEVEGLRSVFTFHDGTLVQVVLQRNDSIVSYETEEKLDSFAEKLVDGGVFPLMELGQPVVNIAIISQKQTNEHCILMRTSHGVYDGMSLPFLWKRLKCAIEEEESPSGASFAEFTSDLADRTTLEAYEYWRSLLKDMSIASIPGAPEATSYAVFQKTLTRPKQVAAPSSLASGITPAIVVKAAWALVLHQFLDTKDVFFGHNTSGRNVAHPTVAEAIGCCADYVPVRVSFDPRWTGSDLLRVVGEQQLTSARYEALGIRRIIDKCTSWPSATRFTSVVNFPYFGPNAIQIGSTQYSITKLKRQDIRDTTELSILCIQHAKHMNLVLGYAAEYFTAEYADCILTALKETISVLSSTPDRMLADYKMTVTPNNPVAPKANGIPVMNGIEDDENGSTALEQDVTTAWQTALGGRRGAVSDKADGKGEDHVWNAGGDIIDATYLMSLLQDRGLSVDLDDIVENPTRQSLARLCQTRRSISSSVR